MHPFWMGVRLKFEFQTSFKIKNYLNKYSPSFLRKKYSQKLKIAQKINVMLQKWSKVCVGKNGSECIGGEDSKEPYSSFSSHPRSSIEKKKKIPVDEVLKKNRNYSNFFLYGEVGRENLKKKIKEKKKNRKINDHRDISYFSPVDAFVKCKKTFRCLIIVIHFILDWFFPMKSQDNFCFRVDDDC